MTASDERTSHSRVLLVDDQPLFRHGLCRLLRGIDPFLLIEENEGLGNVLAISDSGPYRLVLFDPALGGIDGSSILDELRRRLPLVPLVAVSANSSPVAIRNAIDGGAAGFIPKSLSPERMTEALRRVLDRRVYLPEEAFLSEDRRDHGLLPELTDRQLDVLRSVVQGKSNKAVARELGVSSETVKTHLSAAMRALGARNRTELVFIAARRGLRVI